MDHRSILFRDNKARGAIVRYMKNGAISRISRPINKLYPTECKKCKDEVIPKFIYERDIPTNI